MKNFTSSERITKIGVLVSLPKQGGMGWVSLPHRISTQYTQKGSQHSDGKLYNLLPINVFHIFKNLGDPPYPSLFREGIL